MTPTPEMMELAKNIADKAAFCQSTVHWAWAYSGALAAIVETTESAATFASSALVEIYEDSPEIDTECNDLVRRVVADLRNGEHLK